MGGLPSKIGTYRVVRQLGEGGMGTIFEAVHETIERRVAIKVLHPEFARNAEFTARFFNEAREQEHRRRFVDIEGPGMNRENVPQSRQSRLGTSARPGRQT